MSVIHGLERPHSLSAAQTSSQQASSGFADNQSCRTRQQREAFQALAQPTNASLAHLHGLTVGQKLAEEYCALRQPAWLTLCARHVSNKKLSQRLNSQSMLGINVLMTTPLLSPGQYHADEPCTLRRPHLPAIERCLPRRGEALPLFVQRQPRYGCPRVGGVTAAVNPFKFSWCCRARVHLQRLAFRLSQMAAMDCWCNSKCLHSAAAAEPGSTCSATPSDGCLWVGGAPAIAYIPLLLQG